jgi:hypothetical protein
MAALYPLDAPALPKHARTVVRSPPTMHRGGSLVLGLALALLARVGAGCAASPSFDGTVYRGRDVAFRVPSVPASWHRVSLPVADLAFRDDPHDASVLVNSRCSATDRDAPLLALTEHLIIGTTDRRITLEETVPFDDREARHTVLTAKLDGVPMAYDIFVMKKDGCVYDLVYLTVPGAAVGASGVAEFDAFVRGFHTVPSAG